MSKRCRILCSVAELRSYLDDRRAEGRKVGVVPTMGALHQGHLSLVREAAVRAEEVVVTIFVNPTQFGPGEDFERYPRDLEGDAALSEGAGATVVFAPGVDEMYPAGEQTRVRLTSLSQGLCGAARPGHFEGVATVVSKLFNVVGPGTYLFGKKDYQQWRLIERMARDLLFPVEVVGCATVRELDGLAMSSRNAYLTPDERVRALSLSRGLQMALQEYRGGERNSARFRDLVHSEIDAQLKVDYVETRDPETLLAVDGIVEGELLVAVAGKLGTTRLIDNLVLSDETRDILRGSE